MTVDGAEARGSLLFPAVVNFLLGVVRWMGMAPGLCGHLNWLERLLHGEGVASSRHVSLANGILGRAGWSLPVDGRVAGMKTSHCVCPLAAWVSLSTKATTHHLSSGST